MPTRDLLTADQAADVIGVNRRTITKWADAGRLPHAMRLPGDTGAFLFERREVQRVADEYQSDTGRTEATA